MSDVDVLKLFRKIAREQSGLELLNIYKGLPITQETKIVSVGTTEIQVEGNRSHVACLYYQGESYLRSKDLPFIIRSKVKSLNLERNYAVLSDFEAAHDNIGMRAQIRVETDANLIATVQFKNSAFEFKTPMVDISASGASIYFEEYIFPFRICQPESELTIHIPIPDFVSKKIMARSPKTTAPLRYLPNHQEGDIHINASGRVVAIRQDAKNKRYRVSVQLYFKDISRMVILQYISHRQAEIIKDLRTLADNLYNSKK